MKSIAHIQCRGYIEGYYGRLLGWEERHAITSHLNNIGMGCYFYAPKEDSYHRLQWRVPYPSNWRTSFKNWAAHAQANSVHIIAGVAPGLDFNFTHINTGADFIALVNKANQLLSDGASAIALLMDDINTMFNEEQTGFASEGEAHAMLANALSDAIGQKVFTVPRVYANELEHESPGYAQHYCRHLNDGHVIFHCGTHIVAQGIQPDDYAAYSEHRIVIWDNLYANDYCPRRLYVGPWLGRSGIDEVMLNPTGMLETDLMLLSIMATTNKSAIQNTDNSASVDTRWAAVLKEYQVPESFNVVQHYFRHPPFITESDCNHTFNFQENKAQPTTARTANLQNAVQASLSDNTNRELAALEILLWKWKTPLSREWYPYLFGLKHDLSLASNRLSDARIRKTQLPPLADVLLTRRP